MPELQRTLGGGALDGVQVVEMQDRGAALDHNDTGLGEALAQVHLVRRVGRHEWTEVGQDDHRADGYKSEHSEPMAQEAAKDKLLQADDLDLALFQARQGAG